MILYRWRGHLEYPPHFIYGCITKYWPDCIDSIIVASWVGWQVSICVVINYQYLHMLCGKPVSFYANIYCIIIIISDIQL